MRALAEAAALVGPHLQAFFAEHLLAHKRASPQTIACYRDTFRLLLRFMRKRTGAEPAALPSWPWMPTPCWRSSTTSSATAAAR